MSSTEQRRFPRITTSIEVRYEFGSESFTDQALNLSLGGLCINADRPLDIGTHITVYFTLPGFDHSFSIGGMVVNKNSEETPERPPGMGIEFTKVDKEDERKLLQFIVQSQLTQKGF